MTTKQKKRVTSNSAAWINGLCSIMNLSETKLESKFRATISSDVKNDRLALFVPTEMAELQPENLRYLHALASRNECMLIEDRRTTDIQPLVEQRDLKPHKLAGGICELLKHTGMPGADPVLSSPQRLTAGNPHFDVPVLIKMVAATIAKSKRVILLPTPKLVETTGNETHPICAHACKVTKDGNTTIVSFFDSPGFKAIGYVSNDQFVMHVFIGGGPVRAPLIWANFDSMLKNRFRFQLFSSKQPGQDFGLLYNTFYMDIKRSTAAGSKSVNG